jgi:hypothetical protein
MVCTNEGLCLEVSVLRAWHVRVGQWPLCLLPSGCREEASEPFFRAIFGSHMERTITVLPEEGMHLFLLMEPRRGFTQRVVARCGGSLMTWVDGPKNRTAYARSDFAVGEYGTVFRGATRVDIAAGQPHSRELSHGQSTTHDGCGKKT